MAKLAKNEEGDGGYAQEQGAHDPPICLRVAASFSPHPYDGRAQAAENADESNQDRKEAAGKTSQDLNWR